MFWLVFDMFSCSVGEGNGNPLQCSCLENPRDGGAWWAAVYGVAQSQTRLKRLSSSSSSSNSMHCGLHDISIVCVSSLSINCWCGLFTVCVQPSESYSGLTQWKRWWKEGKKDGGHTRCIWLGQKLSDDQLVNQRCLGQEENHFSWNFLLFWWEI